MTSNARVPLASMFLVTTHGWSRCPEERRQDLELVTVRSKDQVLDVHVLDPDLEGQLSCLMTTHIVLQEPV